MTLINVIPFAFFNFQITLYITFTLFTLAIDEHLQYIMTFYIRYLNLSEKQAYNVTCAFLAVWQSFQP